MNRDENKENCKRVALLYRLVRNNAHGPCWADRSLDIYRFLIDLSEQGRHELRRRNSWKRNPGAGAVLLPIPEMLRQ